jgi:hypothetical protein
MEEKKGQKLARYTFKITAALLCFEIFGSLKGKKFTVFSGDCQALPG